MECITVPVPPLQYLKCKQIVLVNNHNANINIA